MSILQNQGKDHMTTGIIIIVLSIILFFVGGYFYQYALTPVTTIQKSIQERIDCLKNGLEKLLGDLIQEIGSRNLQ